MKGEFEFFKTKYAHRELRDLIFEKDFTMPEIDGINHLDLYLYLLKQYTFHVAEYFNAAFPKNYRRRSDKFTLDFYNSFNIDIRIRNDYTVEITLGLILALEDANQSIYSDMYCLIGGEIGETSQMRNVLQLQENELTDQFRYFDYSIMLDILKITKPDKLDFIPFFFRLLSSSYHRRDIADLSSNMSLEWLFSHEDAHIYLGHVAYSKSFTQNHNFFQEFNTNVNAPKSHNIYCEYDADRNAAWRMVDTYFIGEFYDFYDEIEVTIDFIAENSELDINTIRAATVANLILTSGIINLIIFQRCLMKYIDYQDNYPKIKYRILNLIMETIHRLFSKILNYNNRDVISEFLNQSIFTILSILQEQLELIRLYIIDFSYINKDSNASIYNKDFIELEPFFNDIFFEDLNNYCSIVFGNQFKSDQNKQTLKSISEKNRHLFLEFTQEWKNYIEYSNTLLNFRLGENPNIKDKILENIANNNSMLDILNKNVQL